MTLRKFGGKYIIYDKLGKVVIISKEKRIAIAYARSLK